MKKAVYPGSFDPVTLGHLDIIARASRMVDELVVAVLNNNSKSPLFSVDERVKMLQKATAAYPNVTVTSFSGLTVDFVKKCDANVMIRGLRAVTDFEYELQMAQTNRTIAPDVDTIFLTTSLKYSYLSSSIVKEIAYYDGDISRCVPDFVADAIHGKLADRKKQ